LRTKCRWQVAVVGLFVVGEQVQVEAQVQAQQNKGQMPSRGKIDARGTIY
jgi:hypothetical protein